MKSPVEQFVESLRLIAKNIRPNVPDLPAKVEDVENWNRLHAEALKEKNAARELLLSPQVRTVIESLGPVMGFAKPYSNTAPVLEDWVVRLQSLKESLDEYTGERWLPDAYTSQYKNPYRETTFTFVNHGKRRLQRELRSGVERIEKKESFSLPPKPSKLDEYHVKIISSFASDVQRHLDADGTAQASTEAETKRQQLIENDHIISGRLALLSRVHIDRQNNKIRVGNENFSGLTDQQVDFFYFARENWPEPIVLSAHDLRMGRIKKDLPTALLQLIDKNSTKIDVTKLRQDLAEPSP